VLRATVIRFSYWYRGESSRERKFLGAKVPCNFRSRERKFQGTKVPGSESTRERKSEGAKVPRSESSTYGTWERKFHNSAPMIVLNDNLSNPANFTPTMQTSVLCAVLKIAEFRYGSAVAPNASFSRVLSRMSWFLADSTTVALMLQCCVCRRRRLSSVTYIDVAKRYCKQCVLEQKLLLTAYRELYMRNRLVPKWMTLTFVQRSFKVIPPLRHIRHWISRKPLEIEAWFQLPTSLLWGSSVGYHSDSLTSF